MTGSHKKNLGKTDILNSAFLVFRGSLINSEQDISKNKKRRKKAVYLAFPARFLSIFGAEAQTLERIEGQSGRMMN